MINKKRKKFGENKMNLPELEKIMQDFYLISGMDIAVVDAKNRIIARRHPSDKFCSQIHKCQRCLKVCEASDDEHIELARKTRKLVKYTCPYGIFEAITPIFENDSVIAFLFLGMAIENDESHIDSARQNLFNSQKEPDSEALNKIIDEIPKHSIEKLNAFADMLPIIAEHIENNNLVSVSVDSIGLLAKRYIKNNLSEKITLTDIAWHLHCSTVTLTEHFKKEFNVTIAEYIMQKRMQMATRLLKGSEIDIREVAESCGFANTGYFSKAFKKHFGMSPKEWRNINK